MSNFYLALKHAHRDLHHEDLFDITQVAHADIPEISLEVPMEQEMVDLYRKIDSLLPDTPKRILQFIGTRAGDGVSTIVREYAAMATARFGKSVLILDANQGEDDQRHFFNITHDGLSRIGDSNLYVRDLSRNSSSTPLLFDVQQLETLFVRLKMRFDLVLLDSTPLTSKTDYTLLSRCADGVLLILEADKTRWPLVENIKTKITNSGGNILGLVFNKRRHHIPEYFYQRL